MVTSTSPSSGLRGISERILPQYRQSADRQLKTFCRLAYSQLAPTNAIPGTLWGDCRHSSLFLENENGRRMSTGRLEAFSDGVIAIIITVMVFKIETPSSSGPSGIREALPAILTFAMSFLYLAIYWNNHHHMLQATKTVNGAVLWANMHLLFWLSLIPFVTSWLYESNFATWPVVAYGFVLWVAAMAYLLLQNCIVRMDGCDSVLRRAIGRDWKGRSSVFVYASAVALAFWSIWAALAIYIGVALVWLVPDRRIERAMRGESD